MPITEMQRTSLANQLIETIGEESTDTLMQSLIFEGRDQLATKADILATKADIKATKADIAEVKAELKTDIAGLQTQMAELRADLFEQFFKLTRYLTFLIVGSMATTWATMIPLILAT
ncbi:hypothetical protein [Candidatus Poriferisocius sp.]|uniref:hypothetical protein n=1 Tax=Candidatus Poriferisocius sp. TaxID=3101276 RepID=UPI003B01248B